LIAADTSSLVAFLAGHDGADVTRIDAAIQSGELVVPPPVLTELASKPDRSMIEPLLQTAAVIELTEGFWRRAGESRRALLARGLKAGLADALIAQCCIDAGVALITRDRDYRHFARWCGLKLAD